jgi:hypothetical protein
VTQLASADARLVDSRRRPRFLMKVLVVARFAGFEVALHDIGESGCQIHHAEPLKLASAGALVFQNPSTRETLQIQGRVVWSRLAKEGEDRATQAYHSALRFDPIDSQTHMALAKFVSECGQYDWNALEKKRQAFARKDEDRRNSVAIYKSREDIPQEVLEKILDAREWLQLNPAVGQKWYQRARFAKERFLAAEKQIPYQDEVLAVWELLNHKYPVNVVALALNRA